MDTPIREVRVGVPQYERVMARVERIGECLEFMGARRTAGYGVVGNRGAHVIVWEHYNGPVPDGLMVRHTCDNPPCVDINHLLVGTQKDNRQDAVQRARTAVGERHGRAKLTPEQVIAIRADDRSAKAIARAYGMSDVQILNIKKRKSWSHL
jgi:HNH endonuclease